ncbi:MAG: TonB-dependent receptor [Verrucomicrobia bacterium]|nr:TonB-dependent receptor [Verrucomicrobiota bacterium]
MSATMPQRFGQARSRRSPLSCLLGLITSLGLGVAWSSAQASDVAQSRTAAPAEDLARLSLEELGTIKVTTVSRKSESLSSAAAAIHVITEDDLRRSGVTALPEALRMVPGLQVARSNSRQWGISARGFNEAFSNKLLVLMDGRSIYTPLFSGVFWEETDTDLEDIERIEVIRGPGATLWGANAVNGIINIITKNAKETQGTLVSGGGGVEERGFGTARYGGRLGPKAFYRIYGKYSNRDEFTRTDGRGAGDSSWFGQSGFRVDWEPSGADSFTLQGDSYYGDIGGTNLRQSFEPPTLFLDTRRSQVKGGNVLGRWTHDFSSDSDFALQVYYDRTDREFGIARDIRDTIDLDAQHRFGIGDRQEFIWGGGYRYSVDDIKETSDFRMRDPNDRLQLFSVFAQDEIALVPDRVRLTLGTKVEHHEFTGFEVQPSGRLAWTPGERYTLWGAVSRAVRTPSRADRDLSVFADPSPYLPPLPFPIVSLATGNEDLDSEELLAYEIGSRIQVHPRLSLDCAAFYNDYERLRSIASLPANLRTTPGPPPTTYLFLPLTVRNDLFGETYGAEISVNWQPLDAWRLRANYSFLRMQLHSRGPATSFTEDTEGNSPQHQFALWSHVDFGRAVEWGLGVRYVDDLEAKLLQIPAYTELEARLAWKPNRHCEVAVVGNNLLHAHHQEFNPVVIFGRNVEVDRAVYAKVTLRF